MTTTAPLTTTALREEAREPDIADQREKDQPETDSRSEIATHRGMDDPGTGVACLGDDRRHEGNGEDDEAAPAWRNKTLEDPSGRAGDPSAR